jgi:hypothetical protein
MRIMAACRNNRRSIAREDGVAMITTMMVLVLVSVLMVGFVTAIVADQRASGLDRDQTQAYAAAHAGLEQLTADLSGLFATDFSPSATDIGTLTAAPPTVPNFTFVEPGGGSGYRIGFNADPNTGNPMAESTTGTTIAAGPYQGLRGIITPYDITVTARSRGGAEVRMRRTLQTVAMPVFQFGFFSDQDLGFHNSDATDFQFGGRVHTNGSLYLTHCCSNGNRLTLPDRITSVNEIIRTHLMNGLDASADYRGTVRVIKNAPNSYRNLATDEGSLVTNDFSVLNEPNWTALSVGTYASNIRNGRTGARRLELPLQTTGQNPVEIIRRPAAANEPTANAPLYNQRFYSQASLRILLSDTEAAITSLPEVTGLPVLLGGAWDGASNWTPDKVLDYGPTPADDMRSPIANSESPTYAPNYLLGGTNYLPALVYRDRHNFPLIGGYIKIDLQRQDGTWIDVTKEILGLGISGRNLADANSNLTPTGSPPLSPRWNRVPDTTHTTQPPPATGSGDICAVPHQDAVIRLQRVRDIPQELAPCGVDTTGDGVGDITGTAVKVSQNEHDYWPLTLFDPREGYVRDGSAGLSATDIKYGGLVHYIELDANNLRRWLAGQIGSSGTQARNDDGRGFIVYFSDRRTNSNGGAETGEYGYEDVVNPGTAAGTPNGGPTPDAGEDVNGNGTLDVYGGTPVNPTGAVWISADVPGNNVGGTFPALTARANRPIFFRRALKVVNGGIFTTAGAAPNCSPAPCNNLPAPGVTIASENPVYVQGNFNATATSVTQEPNVAAAIIADAVTLLSNSWNDLRSFTSPHAASGRAASQTGFRMAVLAGKSRPFARPTGWTSMRDFGTDGGVHDFLRSVETWGNNQLTYNGSLVSFFTSRQAVGTYKSGVTLAANQRNIFSIDNRTFTFDTDFLAPATLPPGTPSFRDVNTLTFRQLLRPTQ